MTRYIAILLSALSLGSCAEWLDVLPKTSVQEKEMFNSEYGFKDVLTGFYIYMGDQELYGRSLTYGFLDILARRYDNSVVASNLYNSATPP